MKTYRAGKVTTAHGLATHAVHAGRAALRDLGVHALPIDLSTTYPLSDLDRAGASVDAFAAGAASAPDAVYGRLYNPTVARFEEALASLEACDCAVAFGSGMAAVTATLLAMRSGGWSHVVAVRPLYGGTDHLLASGLLGIDVTYAPVDGVAEALRPETGLVIIETPANPTCALVDIAAVVAAAGAVPVLVDSTFATPVLQQPAKHGATLVLHSATKFLGGHGDVIAGVVACDAAWAAKLRQVRILTGALLHPLGAYLLHRGLQTLPLRVLAAQRTATSLASRLAAHPAVARVLHPSRPGGDPARLVGRQMAGPGAVLGFELRGGQPAASALMRGLRLITPAVSLGSCDTLIQHPAGLTHRIAGDAALAEGGVSAGLLRISVGLEDEQDLWQDLRAALDAVHGKNRTTVTASHVRAAAAPTRNHGVAKRGGGGDAFADQRARSSR
jgi:methionine-gamma-lyase